MTPNLTQIPCNATDLIRYKQQRIDQIHCQNFFSAKKKKKKKLPKIFLIDFIRSIPIFLV